MGKQSNGKGERLNVLRLTLQRGNMAEMEALYLEQQLERVVKREARRRSHQERLAQGKGSHEFTGCIKATKVLKQGLGGLIAEFADKKVTTRLTGLHSKIVKNGDGAPGRRAIRVQENAEYYFKFKLVERCNLSSSDFLERLSVSANAERNTVKVELPSFLPDYVVNEAVKWCGFRLVLAAVVMSDLCYSEGEEPYTVLHPELCGKSVVVDTGFLPRGERVAPTELVAALPGLPFLPDGTVLLAFMGIEFSQRLNSELFPLVSGRAMDVVGVF